MNLADIERRLEALGVTLTYGDDDPDPLTSEMLLQRQYRASLFIARLEQTRAFLTGTLAGAPAPGVGPADYPFIAPAMARGELLNDLAQSLDEWVCVALESRINTVLAAGGAGAPKTYEGWFEAEIFTTAADIGGGLFNARVTAFYALYPIAGHALDMITTNFQNNIAKAVGRILADRPEIAALFHDVDGGPTLEALAEVQSTGSDFHKGGQQVLILTFAVRWSGGTALFVSTLKLVYKPADLEIDCLIYGNSAAVNHAVGNPPNPVFQAQSLVEIFNAYATTNPGAGLVQLPTYRVLPRQRTNGAPLGPGGNVPIRDAYGYIEFLGHEGGKAWDAFNFFGFGANDFVISYLTNFDEINERFYLQEGQLLALASTFSIVDLHIENVRVRKYEPYLIDLEVSLTEALNEPERTLLTTSPGIDSVGGFTGAQRSNETFVYDFQPAGTAAAPRVVCDKLYVPTVYANRLYAMCPGKRLVPVDVYWLLRGLDAGLAGIGAIQTAQGFNAWLQRINNVLVRILPVATVDWNAVRRSIYDGGNRQPTPPPPALAPRITEVVLAQTTDLYRAFAQPGAGALPEFVGSAAAQVAVDLSNFDIPVFYHQIGTTALLDSMGAVIGVPQQVTIENPNPPPPTAAVNSNVGRVTYFAGPPTAANVLPKLQALAGGGNVAVMAGYQQQLLQTFQLAGPPANPGVM